MAELKDKEDIVIKGRKYFIGRMPALAAERLLIKSIGSLSQGGFSALPQDALMELLSYSGGYNAAGGMVHFDKEDVINFFDVPLEDLMELQLRVAEKTFGFFADGGINRLTERLMNIFTSAKKEQEKIVTPEAAAPAADTPVA